MPESPAEAKLSPCQRHHVEPWAPGQKGATTINLGRTTDYLTKFLDSNTVKGMHTPKIGPGQRERIAAQSLRNENRGDVQRET